MCNSVHICVTLFIYVELCLYMWNSVHIWTYMNKNIHTISTEPGNSFFFFYLYIYFFFIGLTIFSPFPVNKRNAMQFLWRRSLCFPSHFHGPHLAPPPLPGPAVSYPDWLACMFLPCRGRVMHTHTQKKLLLDLGMSMLIFKTILYFCWN